ncbi:hypothetical protein GBA52_024306 [Prunus armeniaca]|nr:hypothetical protein GBA52_024306 [Prunus armeniaca]
MGRFRYVDPAATSRPHSSARSSSKTPPTNKSPVSSTPPPKSAFIGHIAITTDAVDKATRRREICIKRRDTIRNYDWGGEGWSSALNIGMVVGDAELGIMSTWHNTCVYVESM